MLELVDVDLKKTRFYQEVFADGCQEGSQAERRRIAKSLLDLIPDDRLLSERTGLTELEIRQLRDNNF